MQATSFAGIYVDGDSSSHAGFHANVAALAFGLVPPQRQSKVINFIKGEGMAGSVYFAQYLLESLYTAGEADYALSLLTSKGKRSWYNMIRNGATITTEAWDDEFKPNQDWNHAWGAVPGNIVGRFVLGVKPLKPGFSEFEIKPQLGDLRFAEGRIPSIKGDIIVLAKQSSKTSFELVFTIPPNTQAIVKLPRIQKRSKPTITVNGRNIEFDTNDTSLDIGKFGSGFYHALVKY